MLAVVGRRAHPLDQRHRVLQVFVAGLHRGHRRTLGRIPAQTGDRQLAKAGNQYRFEQGSQRPLGGVAEAWCALHVA
ncbi:hypothetical protein D3C85_1651500 [compost metagenome]